MLPSSSQRVFRICVTSICRYGTKRVVKKHANVSPLDNSQNSDGGIGDPSNNELGIPMIAADLHRRLFEHENMAIEKTDLEKIRSRIEKAAGVKIEQSRNETSSNAIDDVALDIPELKSETVEEHFNLIAEEQVADYRNLAKKLAATKLPPMPAPNAWVNKPGWTKYAGDDAACSVDYPEEDVLVFDVEVCMQGIRPTIAVAVSEKAWYSWCSEELCNTKKNPIVERLSGEGLLLKDLIPLESKSDQQGVADQRKRLVIGHHVAFDRTYVKEQYYLQKTELRFLDTMSMHIATSGFANVQRALKMKNKKATETMDDSDPNVDEKESEWLKRGSMNSLVDVYKHHCTHGNIILDKNVRDDLFVNGTIADVRKNFEMAMSYCAQDVAATFEVFSALLPDFLERFPHPVTLAGMLEMGTAYLPINDSWRHFVNAAERSHKAELNRIDRLLVMRANEALALHKDDAYKDDVWLWDEDWSTYTAARFYKISAERSLKKIPKEQAAEKVDKIWNVFSNNIRKATPYLPKLPKWYRGLCKRSPDVVDGEGNAEFSQDGATWGPRISLQMRIAPKLLRMLYHGYPLHYHANTWGYLVPDEAAENSINYDNEPDQQKKKTAVFPLERLKQVVLENRNHHDANPDDSVNNLEQEMECGLPGVKFYKLPHKDGAKCNVGSPLSKPFIHLIDERVITSYYPEDAKLVAEVNRTTSYWRITRDRILSQLPVYCYKFNENESLVHMDERTEDACYGAILPRVITAGTVTRRAVEPLWMTASNAKTNRIGSEVKGLVQSPPGYVFVGADVDSQELWIAALLGDSWKYKMHGCTPFSWMLLRGNKADGTDQHSMVAAELGVTRDDAKVLNYGRIYGAGLPFAIVLLKKFRPGDSQETVQKLANALYYKTKGRRKTYCLLTEQGEKVYFNESDKKPLLPKLVPLVKVKKVFSDKSLTLDEHYFAEMTQRWVGGTESEVFNRLESIALSDEAATPVLGCRLSKALELGSQNKEFLPSRVNWVVQSSAVDYLHLMLVCMRWLFDTYKIDGRFAISIHDEVRYLVSEKDKYRAALALQITNLLTRAMFVSKMGMTGLPQSVAYFNKVDVDKALRKEVDMDCVTPSNELGLSGCYQIPNGEALDMRQILEKTGGGRLDEIE